MGKLFVGVDSKSRLFYTQNSHWTTETSSSEELMKVFVHVITLGTADVLCLSNVIY